MSTYMRAAVEQQNEDGSWRRLDLDVWDTQSYALYGWLADVRNYSGVIPLDEPRGLPHGNTVGEEAEWGYPSQSWYAVSELLRVDYNQIVEDRRVTRNGNGGATCEPGEGKKMKLSEFLGRIYMEDLEKLRELPGRVRVVFWFD